MNKLKRLFNPSYEEKKEDEQKLNKIIQRLKDDKHCRFCIHSIEKPHYEMQYEAGTDVYCKVWHELRLSYPTGQQCVWWEERK